MAAVREPSEPSMNPLSMPVWSKRIIDIMMSAMCFQFVERVFEWQPLADAEMKLSIFLHLLEDEEVFPVAEVLHAGDAVGEGIMDSEFVAFAALFQCRRRDDFVDEALRRFAKNAGGFAAASGRWRRLAAAGSFL